MNKRTRQTVKDVFELCGQTAMVTNVRDAVSALDQETKLSETVPWFGDRSFGSNVSLAFFKAYRSRAEEKLLKAQQKLLEKRKIGPRNLFYLPCTNNGQGTVDVLRRWDIKEMSALIGSRPLQFFHVTPEAEKLTAALGKDIFGPSARATRLVNDKIFQRELSTGMCREKIFPAHEVAQSEQEVVKAFRIFYGAGAVCLKVGHLASGEGMIRPKSEQEARVFWRKWSANLRENGYAEKIIVERWRDGAIPMSTQYFVHQDVADPYLGCSYQHIGKDGVSHKGNVVGADIRSKVPSDIEAEMRRKSEILLGLYPGISYFVNFDFIAMDDEVLVTEVNLRGTATTVVYALQAQMDNGHKYCYNMKKICLERCPRVPAAKLVRMLDQVNTDKLGILPLTIRYFDQTGEAFFTAYAPTYRETEKLFKLLKAKI